MREEAGGDRVTVAVIVIGGLAHLRRCLVSLLPQIGSHPVDVVVPIDHTVADAHELRVAFPTVDVLDLGMVPTEAPPGTAAAQHELFEKRIAAIFRVATGSHVALLQDWGAPAPDWCEQLMEATRLPHAAVGGAVDNAGRGVLNWAVYFLDFGRHQSPLPSGPCGFLSDVNVVYRRAPLEQIRSVWEQRYNEVLVNWALRDNGHTLWRRPGLIVLHDRGRLAIGPLLAERFSWGRSFGAARARALSSLRLLPYIVLSPLIPFVISARTAVKVLGGDRNRLRFLRTFPAFFLLTVVWTMGEVAGYVTGRSN